jgi:hypothetical protein
VRLNAPNPGLEATLASEKHRNEVEKQLVIMLLPMPLRRPSAVGQWRGADSHDTNRRFRITSIAKIGGSKPFASRAPENEAVRDRRRHGWRGATNQRTAAASRCSSALREFARDLAVQTHTNPVEVSHARRGSWRRLWLGLDSPDSSVRGGEGWSIEEGSFK